MRGVSIFRSNLLIRPTGIHYFIINAGQAYYYYENRTQSTQ